MRCTFALMLVVAMGSASQAAPRDLRLPGGIIVEIDDGDEDAPKRGKKAAKPTARPKIDASAKVKEFLKDNCNDPDKLSFVSMGNPVLLAGWKIWTGKGQDNDFKFMETSLWRPLPADSTAIQVKYRTANSLGAIILRNDVFILNSKGDVDKIIQSSDLRSPAQKGASSDPHMDGFLKQFR